MSKTTKVLLGCCLFIVAAFYLAPIYFHGSRILPQRRFNLNEARNYYTILSSFITLWGLLLGYVYYIHKLDVDKKAAEQERRRKRLDYLINEMNNYDDLVDEIIHFRMTDSLQLARIREKISRSYETIIAMLMYGDELLGFNDEEARTILRVHSFVEKNDILMRSNFEGLNKETLLSQKSQYVDLIQEARKVCFEKIC